jgi:hypothetical protein
MPDSFGARLRRRREERQIDLIAIAEQTKIKLALLEALERDDVSHWPSGIFRRSYIRTYAAIVGLDPDAVLREFLDVHPDPADVLASMAALSDGADDPLKKSGPPPTRLRTIVDSAIESLARRRRGPSTEAPPARHEPVPQFDAIPAAAVLPQIEPELAHEWTAHPVDDHVDDPTPSPPGLPAPEVELAIADDRGQVPPEIETPLPSSHLADESTLEAVAHLCTELGRAVDRIEVQNLLGDSAQILEATGLIVWLWDEAAGVLKPALVHGYSDKVLAYLPEVPREADNATAAALRSGEPCEVAATARSSGALVVPMHAPEGCAGVFAIELRRGVQPSTSRRSLAMLLAAALTQLVHRSSQDEQRLPIERNGFPLGRVRPPLRPAKVRRQLSDAV